MTILLFLGVLDRPRGSRGLLWGGAGRGLAGPAGEVVAGAQRALRRSPLSRLERGRDRTDQPGVDRQAVGGRRLVDLDLERVRQAGGRARGAPVVEVDRCRLELVAVGLRARLRDDELDLPTTQPQLH